MGPRLMTKAQYTESSKRIFHVLSIKVIKEAMEEFDMTLPGKVDEQSGIWL